MRELEDKEKAPEYGDIKYLVKHSAVYGLGTVLGQLVAFLMLPVYTRYLTPRDYGILNLVEISTFLLGLVITTGIAQTVSRFYHDYETISERNITVSTMYITYLGISLVVTPILLLSSSYLADNLLDSKQYTEYFYVSIMSFVFGGLLDIGLVYLRVLEKSHYFTLFSISRLIMLLSLNIYFIVFVNLGVLGILYSTLITNIFYQILLTIPILYIIKLRFSITRSISMLKFSLPLIPAQLANTFVNQSDRYFIKYFISISDTGIYSLAQKLGTAIHMIITSSFQSAFEPKRYEIVKNLNAKELFNKIFIYHMIVLVFVGLGISLYVPEILKILTTPEYYIAGQYVPLIVLSMIILGFRNHFEFGLLWAKETKYYAYANVIMTVLNIISNFILIWYFGLWGAILSYTFVTIVHNIIIYSFSEKHYQMNYEFGKIVKLLCIGISLYSLSIIFKTGYLLTDTVIKSVLLFSFPCLIIFIGIITKEEATSFRTIYRTRIKSVFNSLNPNTVSK